MHKQNNRYFVTKSGPAVNFLKVFNTKEPFPNRVGNNIKRSFINVLLILKAYLAFLH